MRSLLVALLLMPVASSMLRFEIKPVPASVLAYLYDNLSVEFAFCAYGKRRGDLVTIEHVTLPVIMYASPSMVHYNYETCPTKKNLLGMGHSHPGDSVCNLSRIDVHSLLVTPYPYAFLVCQNRELKAFAKSEVRSQLLERGLLADALNPP